MPVSCAFVVIVVLFVAFCFGIRVGGLVCCVMSDVCAGVYILLLMLKWSD